MPDLTSDQADTYKCFARNEYGTAVVTATLNVIESRNLIFFYLKRENFKMNAANSTTCKLYS